MVPLLMKMTARLSLQMAAARTMSAERPGLTVRVLEAGSGRTVVRIARGPEPDAGVLLASYRDGELVLPGATPQPAEEGRCKS